MPFPNRMVIQGDRFYVASRRRRKERFLGMIRQIKLSPGMSIASLMCDHQSPHFDPNLAEERPTKSKKEFRIYKFFKLSGIDCKKAFLKNRTGSRIFELISTFVLYGLYMDHIIWTKIELKLQ